MKTGPAACYEQATSPDRTGGRSSHDGLPHANALAFFPQIRRTCYHWIWDQNFQTNGADSSRGWSGHGARVTCLSRVTRNLRRIIVIGSDGYCTFDGLRSIADIGAAMIFLDRRGKLLFASGPTAPSDARLRRSQSLALVNGSALRIAKELIQQKLHGQSALVRDMLQNTAVADAIEKFRDELTDAESIESVRLLESRAAKIYWGAWADVPVRWPRKDQHGVREHWKHFESRISPLTHSPRLAATPVNACLNLLYCLCETEARLAAVAVGLDPAIGLLHVDTPNRDSLACDLMEVIRPSVDAFVLNWIQSEPLRKSDFWEDRNGNCRIASSLVIKLCETSDTWRRLVAPVAEYVAQELWSSISKSTYRFGQLQLASRLTQAHRRAVKGSGVPVVNQPKPEHMCRDCGVKIPADRQRCLKCSKQVTGVNFRAGRKSAQRPEFLAKRASTMRRHKQAIQNWEPSDIPAWFTRDVYVKQVQPVLASVAKSRIRAALGVSEPYSSDIQAGRRIPHPRHWQALAKLVGVSGDV
jgi:CRISPR-associated endonuclease Cas1